MSTPDIKTPMLDAINSLRRFTALLFVLLALLTILIFGVRAYDLAHVEQKAEQNRIALCALRDDLGLRIDRAQRFLDEHPGGLNGLSGAEIRETIQNQRRTIQTLKIINCHGLGEV